jgi:hypothetical protein
MKKLTLALSIALFTIFIARAQESQPKPPANPNAPEMKFEKTTHDYGQIKKTATNDDPIGDCEFKFTNTGKEPLIIQSATASCGCTVPSWPKEPILPGKSAVIKVHYATTRVGTINKQISVKSNAKNSPIVLTITGTVLDTQNETPPVNNNQGAPTNK